MNTMPTQRPFFHNFFAAFRARSTPGPFQAKSAPVGTSHTHTLATPVPSAPRNIVKPDKTNTTQAQFTGLSSSPGATFYRRPPSPSPNQAPVQPVKSPAAHTHTSQLSRGRQRRDSGSSGSSGFVDAAEKWYVGGRTATGEERFYQLGLVTTGAGKRVRSLDRLSL